MGGEMKGYHKIKEQLYNKVLSYRRLMYMMETDKFEDFWSTLEDKEKTKIELKMLLGEINYIKDRIRNFDKGSLSEMRVVTLRSIARKVQLYNYSRLSREDLIKELERYYAKRRNADKDSGDDE